MAKIEFTAVLPSGEIATRSSGTMPYVATVGGVTWHKTFAAAHKAAQTNGFGKVIPVTMTKFLGKVTPEWEATMTEGWGDISATAMAEVIGAKLAGKTPKANLDTRVETAPVPSQEDIEATLQAEWEYEAPEGATVETVGTIVGGVVTSEDVATGEVTVTNVETPVKVSAEPTIKLRITSRVSAHLVTVERGDIEAAIIAKMAAAKKRTDGSVTIATTAEERDMLVVHCTAMESDNLAGAGFHDLDRLNKVNAARWLVAKITEAEAAADVA